MPVAGAKALLMLLQEVVTSSTSPAIAIGIPLPRQQAVPLQLLPKTIYPIARLGRQRDQAQHSVSVFHGITSPNKLGGHPNVAPVRHATIDAWLLSVVRGRSSSCGFSAQASPASGVRTMVLWWVFPCN